MSHLSVQGEQSTNAENTALTNLAALATSGAGEAIAKTGPLTFANVSSGGGTPTAITVANEATDITCFPLFVTAATGDLGPKTNAGLAFNSNTGLLTATGFSGPLTGNVTGNVSGTAATVTTAAQPSITSLGTLTVLQVDNLNINGNTISASSGAVNITPEAGSAIVLDGTISIDAGVVTGATSISSTGFTGALTGNASTATALQNARTIGGTSFDGTANITVATATGGFTVSGGALALGVNSITMSGSIGVTGTRVTKGWFTDLETTNAMVGSITGNAATITVADEATDTSCFITFVTAATGSLGQKSNANMTFNSNTGVATFASTVLTTTDINGGTVDGATIGASSPTTIVGTTIQANTSFLPDADGGAALGSATLGFSILGLASASTINFANSNVVITHSSAILTMGTGDFRVTNAGVNTASVVTVGGTQTLTAKTLTSPAINTSTLGGHQTMLENAAFLLDPVLSADGTYNGIVRGGTAGATLAFGGLCYLDPTDSRWELCDANAAAGADGDSRGVLGICVLAAAADGSATTMLLMGIVRADAAFPAMTVNNPMYVSETAGDITGTQPVTTDVVIRIVGQGLTGDELWFFPDNAWITHT